MVDMSSSLSGGWGDEVPVYPCLNQEYSQTPGDEMGPEVSHPG